MGTWTPGPGATTGNDVFVGDETGEFASGLGGDDWLQGNGGADWLVGGLGDDILDGGGGADSLQGGDGDDVISGGDGSDDIVDIGVGATAIANIDGGAGNDVISVGAFAFVSGSISGGGGEDNLFTNGNLGAVVFSGIEYLNTGAGWLVTGTASQFHSFTEIRATPTNTTQYVELQLSESGTLNLTSIVAGRGAAVYGASGDDDITLSEVADAAAGGDGNDVLTGLGGVDQLLGEAGNDTLRGGAGNDDLQGGLGSDIIVGGAGADFITDEGDGVSDTTSIQGNDGNDIIDIGTNSIVSGVINGGAGLDEIRIRGNLAGLTFQGIEILNTGNLWHTIGTVAQFESFNVIGTGSNPLVSLELAASGTINLQDELLGVQADFWGADGNDVITLSNGNDDIYGMGGNDVINGGLGADNLRGGDGDDILQGGVGADTLNGEDGIDTATYAGAAGGVTALLLSRQDNTGEAAGDFYSSIENLTGSAFADVLGGNNGVNRLFGGAGNDVLGGFNGADLLNGETGDDVLVGGAGADTLNGAGGFDIADYSGSAGAVRVNLASGVGRDNDAQDDTLLNMEGVTGSAFDDRLTGGNKGETLRGGAGHDVILGQNGDDNLFGAAGNDVLNGGAGADTLSGALGFDAFVFSAPLGAGNIDTITDFSAPEDTIRLKTAIFTQIGGTGTLAASAFRIGASAADASDRIIYDSSTGALYYDPDGVGGAAQIQFATLSTGLALTNADFLGVG